MEKLLKLIEESAVQLVMVEEDDVPGLANLHSHFERICQEADNIDSLPDAPLQLIRGAALASAAFLEKIILQEISNVPETIKVVTQTAQTLQTLINQVVEGKPTDKITFPPELNLSLLQPSCDSIPDSKNTPQIHLPDNVDEEIFKEYLSSQPHVLANLEAAILAAEKDPSQEHLTTIKAILHNFKGESGLMGLREISGYCHTTENLLVDTEASFPAEKLLEAKDWLQKAIAQLTNNKSNIPAAQDEIEIQSNLSEEESTTAENDIPEDDVMVAENDIPLVIDFIQESNEHLESAEGNLLSIEDNPEDVETLNAVFRGFHTIKGVAGFLNLKQIGALAHAAENLLDLARKGNLQLGGVSIDAVFESVDVMKQMLQSLKEAVENNCPVKSNQQVDPLIERIKVCVSGDTPNPRLGEILVEEQAIDKSDVKQALQQQSSEATDKKLGEILLEKNAVTPQQLDKALQTQKEEVTTGKAQDKEKRKVTTESTVKVTTGRLDSLVNMVGELVIAQSMVSQDLEVHTDTNQRLARNVRHLDKITRELQELSMSMRMVPVQGVFQKMARLVRDLSRKAGKEVEYVMYGADTELDRNVVEAIADPLVHMVRNSVDHGVELPEQREKAGKDRVGQIELRAFHQGGNIIIKISDDGKGLDRDRILKKAIANGIVREDAELTDQEVYRLIFHAGLSTAEKITDISGRGVGMDVVRKNIEALRGRVDIDSVPGKGSTFSIGLPLTLAVIDGQVVTVGPESYIIPTLSIEQNLRPTPEQISTIQGGQGEMIMIRDQLVPLVRIHQLYGIEPKTTDPTQALVVAVTDGDHRCCLMVDDLRGQQQVVIKSLGDYLGKIKGISGSAIMGDGNVSLILDVPGLINLTRQK
ncbi:MAG: chemotaxis protein CheA [Planctomycetes bacterium]|nr:chemotaxis protein CheA [Planctomycetota bacterium]